MAAARRPPRRADAIVVLGARLHLDGRPTRSLSRRVAVGIDLYHAGAAPLLLLTGGGERRRPEADAMADAARAAGVPADALLVERRAANTIENAFFSGALLRARGLQAVLLVSDRYHLPRARWLFGRAGLVVVGVAAPPGGGSEDWRMWLRESAALPRSWWRLRRRRSAGE